MNREDPLLERINQVLAENDEPAGRQNGKASRLDEIAADAQVDEPDQACGGVVSAGPVRNVNDEPEVVLPADRAPAAAAYVGFDEEVEPRADQTRGWLARAIARVFG